MDRLSIIDPNNTANDIAGGSSNTKTIMAVFSEAFDILRAQMNSISDVSARSIRASILEPILGGNYSSFDQQRGRLRDLADRDVAISERHSGNQANRNPRGNGAHGFRGFK
jgi:non-canonical poly(A) RNA polymerase PAPD5/7